MTVISSDPDRESLTMTIVCEFEAGVERVWQLWEDPRQLEKWWGPPGWPATFERHDFEVGGESSYFMTGPEGEKAGGWWRMTAIDGPSRIEFEDGFSDEDGRPSTEMPTMHMTATFEEADGTTRMTVLTRFAALDQLEQVLEMGMEEGMKQALSQIDALL
ncbi:MAG: SRPBCC domain-containing protein [Actinomycetota bacterium]|nr:SRPBCC domain-containing protein [Actinomycetota bacterium]